MVSVLILVTSCLSMEWIVEIKILSFFFYYDFLRQFKVNYRLQFGIKITIEIKSREESIEYIHIKLVRMS